ncbi:MAG TPA: rhamnulokinase [Candidatus Ornithospirochaeta stercorigallinarum]|nr:rhamnulokinase [Candidatus Ornithospirochaeta stercorigallinarum]
MVYLAVDIGASSGKILKGYLGRDKTLILDTVHRFPNGCRPDEDGTLVWNLEALYSEIVEGLRKAGYADYIAIDTWGVDFVLLDENEELIGKTVSYRDCRTEHLESWPDQETLYMRTGIQKQKFNTIYQLLSLKETHPEQLDRAASMLFIPDYLAFRLTGCIQQEYTFSSTTNLLDPWKKDWDYELIEGLGLPSRLFMKPSEPGVVVGKLKKDISDIIGYSPTLLLAPSHDSASAVVGAPLESDGIYLSSGTWSIMGSVEKNPVVNVKAMKANLSNEGGVDNTIRLIKNIMGTWILQRLRAESGMTFDELEREAGGAGLIGTFDATDERFLAPVSMVEAIKGSLCIGSATYGELACSVYHSLALTYSRTIAELEEITGRSFSSIAIVGGGSKDGFLNSLTRYYTGLVVTAGPDEGTAIGNLLYQMISTGEIDNTEKNDILRKSVGIITYQR